MPTLFTSIRRESAPAPAKPMIGLLIVGLLAAFWPLGPWFVKRLGDHHDEPLGLLAMLAAFGLLWLRRAELHVSTRGCWGACGIVVAEMLFHRELPALIESVMLVLAICMIFRLPRHAPGVAALLILSLPIVASMQFYLGYPLRAGAAMFSEVVMNLLGCNVTRLGTDLKWHGAQVGVDPPCSGVRMLWVACFVAAVLGARSRMRLGRFCVMIFSAVVMVVLANAVRAMLLLPSEAGVMLPFEGLHEGVGIVVMVGAFWCLVRWHDWLMNRSCGQDARSSGNRLEVSSTGRFATTALIGLGIAVGVMHGIAHDDKDVSSTITDEMKWPSMFEDHTLEVMPQTAFETMFVKTFPGRLARFRCGNAEVVMRHVLAASRMVHSSRECFQAQGFEIKPMSRWVDRERQEWSRFAASRDGESVIVRERITDPQGHAWVDAGAWYWAALFHAGAGPWRFVSVIEQAQTENRVGLAVELGTSSGEHLR